MTLRNLILSVAVLLLVASAACAAPMFKGAAEPCSPGETVKNGHTNYYWTLDDRFVGNETYSVFCGTVGRPGCDGGWKPESVTMYLHWEEENNCALTIQAELHEASSPNPDSPGAGSLLVASRPTLVGPFKPAGLWAVTVALPPDSPVIEGPCFATLRFLDTCSELPSIVAAPGVCESAKSWIDRGQGWVDMHDLDLPGNLTAYATFECQPPTADERPAAEEEVRWATIKSRYGTRE